MRAALRHLCEKGAEALKPQKVTRAAVQIGDHVAQPPSEVWRRPIVSKRVANVLRKQALKDGTYGTFDSTNGVGWDPTWDIILKNNQYNVTRFGGILPSKKTSRERNREARAKKLEANLETRLEKMEEYYTEKEASRVQDKSFEAHYKRLLRGGSR